MIPQRRRPEEGRPFSAVLEAATVADRQALFAQPFVQAALDGDLDLPTYVTFLSRAYHHVHHTVPLLAQARAALRGREPWLLAALDTYITEEAGHDEWILDDIAACGADSAAVRDGPPDSSCAALVGHVRDAIAHENPLALFGMVHVLEGTSVRAASRAGAALQVRLHLPPSAFTYLTSHGELDKDHVAFFAELMDRITDPDDQRVIVDTARACFRLYGEVFASIPLGHATVGPRHGVQLS